MFQSLSQTDAQILLGIISSIIIPFGVSWIKQSQWPDWVKFAIAVGLSLIAGFLTIVATGQLKPDASFIQNGAVIFMAVQAVYFTVFRGMGLEKVIHPKSAVIQQAQDKVESQLSGMSNSMARDILDPDKPSAVNVDTTVVNINDSVK